MNQYLCQNEEYWCLKDKACVPISTHKEDSCLREMCTYIYSTKIETTCDGVVPETLEEETTDGTSMS